MNEVETKLKKEAEMEMERCYDLREYIDYIKNGEMHFRNVPIEHAYHVGLYFLNKRMVRYALDNDPEFEHLKTYDGREDGNYHTLNEWLGEEYANPMDNIKYVVLTEKLLKDNETLVWFLQWTGNENEIKQLETYLEVMDDADYDVDMSLYTIDTEHPVLKQTVEEMCKVTVCNMYAITGKFVGLGNYPSAIDFHKVFYKDNKKRLFEEYKVLVW